MRNTARARLRIAVCLALSVAVGGCSALTVETLPANYAEMPHFRCTSNKVAPGFDLLWGLGGIASAALSFAVVKGKAGMIGGTLGAIGGVGYLISSGYGFTETSKCAHAMDEADLRLNETTESNSVNGVRIPTIMEGLSTIRNPETGNPELRLVIGSSVSPIALIAVAEPGTTIARLSAMQWWPRSDSTLSCDRLDISMNGQRLQLANSPKSKGKLNVSSGGVWDVVIARVNRTALANIIAGSTRIAMRLCGEALLFKPLQIGLLRAFVQRWDDMAKAAPPQPTAEPEATAPAGQAAEPEAAPTTESAPSVAPAPAAPVAPPSPGCQYDTQCKGDRICQAGQCVDAPAKPARAK